MGDSGRANKALVWQDSWNGQAVGKARQSRRSLPTPIVCSAWRSDLEMFCHAEVTFYQGSCNTSLGSKKAVDVPWCKCFPLPDDLTSVSHMALTVQGLACWIAGLAYFFTCPCKLDCPGLVFNMIITLLANQFGNFASSMFFYAKNSLFCFLSHRHSRLAWRLVESTNITAGT